MAFSIGVALALFLPALPQEQGLLSASAARQSIRTGIVELHERWEMPDGVIEYDATAYFDPCRYRLDIHDHSGFDAVVSRLNGRTIDPLRMAFDGERVLDRLVQPSGIATFSFRPENDTRVPLFNARLLGLPGAPSPQISIEKRLRTEGRLIDASTHGPIHKLTIRNSRPARGDERLELVIDAEKGWSVIEYTIQDLLQTSPHFVTKGFVTPASFGETWYPRYVKIEQWRDEKLNWTREYTVSGAQLNVKLDPDTFTWDGLGIYDGAMIESRIPRTPGSVHRTSKPSLDFSHRCDGEHGRAAPK